jgi:uncharacterized membrane protein YdbT with pleckstrin-like domain
MQQLTEWNRCFWQSRHLKSRFRICKNKYINYSKISGGMQMNYKEKKRSMFFGLPWTFTSYTVTEEIITVDTGLFKKEENDCYLYKVIDVRLESTLLERMLGLGTIHCFTGDVTDPDLKLLHIKHAKEIKDYILKQSEQERMKRRTVNMQHLDGNPGMSQMAEKDSCR